jgi:hypothetical protein
MFKNKGIINLDQFFKEKYNYSFMGDIPNLYKQSFIELEGNGVDAMCWITYQENKYLFKPLKNFDINVWGELLSEELNKQLGIPSAEYRIATLGNHKGVITKNILKKDETLILGSEIFQNFFNTYSYKEENKSLLDEKLFISIDKLPRNFFNLSIYEQKKFIFNHLNNLEQVWTILENNKLLNQEELNNIIKSLTAMLLSDLITLQGDRHPNNWAIIKTKTGYKPAQLFDNGTSFGLGFPNMPHRINEYKNEHFNAKFLREEERLNKFTDQISPSFTLVTDNSLNLEFPPKDTRPQILEDLLIKSTPETQEQISNIILNITPEFLANIIKKIEGKNMITMDSNVYLYITNIFEQNLNNLKKVINNFWRSNKNDKSR